MDTAVSLLHSTIAMLIRRAPLSLLALLSTLALQAQAGDVIETSGFTTCLEGSDIVVDKMHLKYDRATSKLDFDLSGVSLSEQYVTASVQVKAYGRDVYSSSFDPCVEGIAQLCPGMMSPGHLQFQLLTLKHSPQRRFLCGQRLDAIVQNGLKHPGNRFLDPRP